MVEMATVLEAIHLITSWPNIGWIILGILLGIIIGALPGLGPALGMAIFLPLSIPLEPIEAIFFLIAIYNGAMYGGSISAILINAPGTPSNAATTFDGYPMSRDGRAVDALAISASASAIGGFTMTILILLIIPLISALVLIFGSPEYFLVAFLGLALITVVARGSMLKGLVMGLFGLLISTIGETVVTVQPRFTFGLFVLYDGLNFVIVLIGVFAIAEIIKLAGESGGIARGDVTFSGSVIKGAKTTLAHPINLMKSALIGMLIGSIPGAGATISNFVAYGEAVRSGKNPDSFGKGDPVGVIATEASNNATVAGSLIPTLAFGIPGSGATAVFLGALLMHGFRPGPDLFTQDLLVTYGLFGSLLIGSFIIIAVGLLLITKFGVLTKIDTVYIIPSVVVLASVGVFSLRSVWLDLGILLLFGLIGFVMVQYNYSVIALVLGVVLGPIAEENLHRTLQLAEGSFLIWLISRPLSALLLLMLILLLVGPLIKESGLNIRDRLVN